MKLIDMTIRSITDAKAEEILSELDTFVASRPHHVYDKAEERLRVKILVAFEEVGKKLS